MERIVFSESSPECKFSDYRKINKAVIYKPQFYESGRDIIYIAKFVRIIKYHVTNFVRRQSKGLWPTVNPWLLILAKFKIEKKFKIQFCKILMEPQDCSNEEISFHCMI